MSWYVWWDGRHEREYLKGILYACSHIYSPMDSPDVVHCEQRVGVEEGIVWDVIASQIEQPWK